MHRRARPEKHDGVPGRKRDVETLNSRRRPALSAVAQIEIREDEGREEYAIADQEEQEALQAQLARLDVELIDVAVSVGPDRSDRHQWAPAATGGESVSSSSSPLYGSGWLKSYGRP